MAHLQVAMEIPQGIIRAARMDVQELKRELAVHLFEEEKLSLGKARELAGMTCLEFQQMLGSRGIPIHYDVRDYEEDIETLRRVERL